jgi:A/G-specific adenine glycosylase
MESIAQVETRRASSPSTSKRLSAFRRVLLRWYDQNRRDLPWRKTRDPYRIWISEIMLQQTRVAAVLEHYRLFLERFPDVRALAAADESAVLAAWSGLGYYRRARMMRLCAQKIVLDHRGDFPKTSAELRSLPGIGRYTAAAIASIAFGEPIAVVDGNVERVLQRLAGSSLTSKEMWECAQTQLSRSRPADFNQAMMELGAIVCTPRQPACHGCPVKKWCVTQGEFPRTTRPQSNFKKEIWFALDQRNGDVRLVQRPADAPLMAGMWELPTAAAQTATNSRSEPAAKRYKNKAHGVSRGSGPPEDRALKGRKNGHKVPWRTFRHSITVTDYTVNVIQAQATQGKLIPVNELSLVPLTGLTRKILKASGII